MSNATLPAQRVDSSLQSSLLRQLERCKNYPASLRETLEVDPYAFLAAQLENYKFLWRDREQGPVQVALGAARHIQALPNESPRSLLGRCRQSIAGMPADQRLVGGFAFCPHGQPLPSPWENFGRGEFWLPRIRLQENQIEVVVIDEDDVAAARVAIRHLIVAEKEFDEVWPAYETRTDLPDFAGWSRNIQQATDLFTAEVLEKVVLARQVTLRFPAPLDAWAILSRLASVTPNCFQFGFQTAAESVFLGATPERLFQRNGESLSSEVVAGTRRRGSTAEEDLRLGHELLASEKDQLEHHIVRKSIRQRLHGCVEGLEVDARAALLQLANKQHLYSRVTGRLRADVRDEDLLERLHPTPAVGGYPTENALAEIERLETFERGWYAAPVGWISQGASEFVVAIRSALLRGRDLHLYSGAGIVPGSTAKSEWDEVESKIQDFLQFMSAESPLLR